MLMFTQPSTPRTLLSAGGSTETSGKKLYMGKEYDFVFDIEIDEPKATLKLPYNTTDSPFMAAQQFIHKHDLSQYYLEEIAQHIITHSGGQKLGAETGGNLDPLTGGSSYSAGPLQGGGAGAPAAGGGNGGGFFDPLTGGGYVSGSGGVEMRQGAPPPDPWMQGAYRTEEAMDTGVEVKNSYFPQTEFLKFDSQVKAEPMVNKLKEFNSIVPDNLRLDSALLEKIPSLATSNTPDPDVSTTLKTLLSWPDAQVFPALDLLRASLLNPSSHTILLEKSSLDLIFSTCLKHVDKTSPAPCQMLALRTLCNLFSIQQGEEFLRTYRESVIARVFEQLFPIAGENKNIQIAAATLLLNYAVSVTKKFDDDTQVQLLSALSINFLTFITDWEARFRTIVAIGTLLTTSPDGVEYAKTLETKDAVRGWRLLEGPAKVSECAQFIENML